MERQKFSFKQFLVPHFWRKLSFMLPSVLMMGVTLSVLILIGWGTDPYDALPVIISSAIPKVPFFVIRILFDFSAIGIGLIAAWISGKGIQGSIIGSVCMSIALGPIISVMSKPLGKILNKTE